MRGSMAVDLLCRWAKLVVAVECGNSAATVSLSWVLLVRGRKGFGWEREGGRKSIHIVLMIGSLSSPQFFNVGCLMPYFSVNKSMGGT